MSRSKQLIKLVGIGFVLCAVSERGAFASDEQQREALAKGWMRRRLLEDPKELTDDDCTRFDIGTSRLFDEAIEAAIGVWQCLRLKEFKRVINASRDEHIALDVKLRQLRFTWLGENTGRPQDVALLEIFKEEDHRILQEVITAVYQEVCSELSNILKNDLVFDVNNGYIPAIKMFFRMEFNKRDDPERAAEKNNGLLLEYLEGEREHKRYVSRRNKKVLVGGTLLGSSSAILASSEIVKDSRARTALAVAGAAAASGVGYKMMRTKIAPSLKERAPQGQIIMPKFNQAMQRYFKVNLLFDKLYTLKEFKYDQKWQASIRWLTENLFSNAKKKRIMLCMLQHLHANTLTIDILKNECGLTKSYFAWGPFSGDKFKEYAPQEELFLWLFTTEQHLSFLDGQVEAAEAKED